MFTEKIWIPLTKSIITAVLVALFAAAWFIPSPGWKLFCATLAGVCLVSWLAVIIPKPEVLETKSAMVRLELTSDGGRRLQFADLPVEHDTLTQFAQGVINGASLTEAAWCGNGGIFTSRSEFVNLRDALIRRNLAAWNNPTCTARGWGLTRSGLAAFRHLAGSPTPDRESEVKMQGVF